MNNNSGTILLDRVRTGNNKLYTAWTDAVDSETPDGYEGLLRRIDKSWPKLHQLCLELQAGGFDGCLYETPRCQVDTGWFCYVCPSKEPLWRVDNSKQLSLVD